MSNIGIDNLLQKLKIVLFGFALFTSIIPTPVSAAGKLDLMVIAPHPDDETLCCAGTIMQVLEQGKTVGVITLTNGDGYPQAASHISNVEPHKLTSEHFLALASQRQQWAEQALTLIQFPSDYHLFLGFPDGGLATMYKAKDNVLYTQVLTGKNSTYRAYKQDYRTSKTGKAAPYQRTAVLQDLIELIQQYQPKTILVTDEADSHSDHQAAFWYIKDALIASQHRASVQTYLIHNGEGHVWPYPYKLDLNSRYQSHITEGKQIPEGIHWPPDIRTQLTAKQAKTKLEMINQFKAEIDLDKDYMHAFAKSEEIFWRRID